jgi:signal peptidase I
MGLKEDKSVTLKLPSGMTFTVPSEGNQIKSAKLRKGDVVTITYDSFSRRTAPVNPKIYRLRKDLEWEDVLFSSLRSSPDTNVQDDANFSAKPTGYWTGKKGKNMRLFLEKFARSRNMDPLLPDTWYSIPRRAIESTKEGTTIMHYSKGGYVRALLKMFPEIGLDPVKFYQYYNFRQHWQEVENRRKWFVFFASERKFDPLLAENWYNITSEKLVDSKAQAILRHYSGDVVSALVHLFPEVVFDGDRFKPRM